jgi:ABC-type multidrug transport system permease subunit
MGLSGLSAELWGIRATFYILAILYLIAGFVGVYLLKKRRLEDIV